MTCGADLIDHRELFAATPAPCLVLTADLVICEVNEAYLRVTARRRDELIGRALFEAFPDNPGDEDATGVRNLRASLRRVLATGRAHRMAVQRYDIAVPGPDGPAFVERWWQPVNTPVPGPGGATSLLVHHVDDVTEAHGTAELLAASERRFRALVEQASDLIIVVGPEDALHYLSPAVGRVLDRTPAELAAARWGDFAHPDDRECACARVARARAGTGGAVAVERVRVLARDGDVRWMEMRASDHTADPDVGGVVVNARDVTAQREVEQALRTQALQDQLTQVPNRRAFLDAARRAVARARRSGHAMAFVLVDVDHFKRVNDTLGHPAGDRLLVEVAARIRRALRPGDTLARLGGDEFVVLLEDLAAERDAVMVAERIRASAAGRYPGPQLPARVTLSLGISTGTGDTDADLLLARADTALYDAKRQGRDRLAVFDAELRHQLVRRLRVERELHDALARDELRLHWQTIVDASAGTVLGAEALLRWEHPTRGLVRPGEFLPVAEEAGLMPRICAWVLDEALGQAARWQELPGAPCVFINLAAHQLGAAGPPDEIARLAAVHGVDPGRVCLEVSEQMLDRDVPVIRERLLGLRAHGFALALDDFGAGNTALAWLQQLPLTMLKLDRRFVASLADPAAQAIMTAVIDLAPALGLACLAEGVETPEQLATLTRLGCTYAQGHHISVPRPADEVTAQLAARA